MKRYSCRVDGMHLDPEGDYIHRFDVKQLQADVDKYKPKSLLFNGLHYLGFHVIVNNKVPENQIWFATKEQLATVLKYSERQVKQIQTELDEANVKIKELKEALDAKVFI